jgi:tetratricopeptide (TPR) repeat protein
VFSGYTRLRYVWAIRPPQKLGKGGVRDHTSVDVAVTAPTHARFSHYRRWNFPAYGRRLLRVESDGRRFDIQPHYCRRGVFIALIVGTATRSNVMRLLLLISALAQLVGTLPIGAQDRIPKRPELSADADSNDFSEYQRLGLFSIQKDPEKAAAAYYWAARLNPVAANAYYGRRTALLLRNPRMLIRYYRGDKGVVNSREALAIDSLYLYALSLDPFLAPTLDHLLFESAVTEIYNKGSVGERASAFEIAHEIDMYLSQGPPEVRAARAYRDGRYDDALRDYALAIKESHHKAPLLAERGRLFYQVGRVDSALVEMTRALEEMRKQDKTDFVYLYESKALMEERIGMIHRAIGDDSAATEAFGRALEEDLSYFPAHVQLGFLALDKKDTTTAASEMDLAVQIRPDDAGLRYQYGFTLGALNRLTQAEEQLTKSIELDPIYAAPHFVLGQVAEAQGKLPIALREYQSFLALSPLNDPRRQEASQEVAILKTATTAAK